MKNQFLYAIRDKETNKFINCKCHGGKYFTRLKDAENKCPNDNYEIVKFELVERKTDEDCLL